MNNTHADTHNPVFGTRHQIATHTLPVLYITEEKPRLVRSPYTHTHTHTSVTGTQVSTTMYSDIAQTLYKKHTLCNMYLGILYATTRDTHITNRHTRGMPRHIYTFISSF